MLNNVFVTKKCPNCLKLTECDMTPVEYAKYKSGILVQEVFPDKDAFYRETLITGMCYDCQSKLFNRPKPGEDWGTPEECPVCGSSVYEKDGWVCPSCNTNITSEEV